jgi:Tetratricopeptide repeat-like domain
MAKHLDLEEQEQLDQLKAFWQQYGNLISSALIVVFGTIAAYNGYNYWQRSQEPGLLGVGGAAELVFHIAKGALNLDGVARLDRPLYFVIHGRGLKGLTALPVVVTVVSRNRAKHHNQR